jgi:LCP family protein required for cell wall assembly
MLAAIAVLGLLAGCAGAPTVVSEASPTAVLATSSPSPTATPTPTASATPAVSLDPTASPAPSPTPSPTATLTPTVALTGTLAPTPDMTSQAGPTPVPTAVLTKDILHILLIGADTGSYAPDQNTDVLIVLSINRKTKQVSMLSIPRDLWVYIPTVGYNRINTAHRYGARRKYEGGGPALLIRTIEENLGIPIDHWVRVDYQGFSGAVDALGGVDLVVPCPTNLRYKPPTSVKEQEMVLEPGIYHMDGPTALRYVRTRRGESDFERAHRQQQFLKGIWDQFKSPDIIPKLPGLWSAMRGYYKTSLGLGDVLALAPTALDLQRHRIRNLYIGRNETQPWTTPEGASVLLPIPEKVQKVVERLNAPPSTGEDAAANEAGRIEVLNGTQRPYLAEIAADQLRWYGLSIAGTGPADRTDHKKTEIVVFRDKPKTLETLLTQFKVKPEAVVRRPDPAQAADIQITLGDDYDPCGK